jgi:tetratricopeptide (TPR) repeat protein
VQTEITRLDLVLRRRSLLGYSAGMALYTLVVVALYPAFKNSSSLDKLIKNDSTISALFGVSGPISTPGGWLNGNLYANFLPLLMLLLTIGYGAASLAGQDEDGTLCHALRVAGETAWFYGQPDLTLSRCQEALAIFEKLGDEQGMSLMYSRIASPLMEQGKLDESAELLDKAVELHRRLGQEQELAMALQFASGLAREQGDLQQFSELLEESIVLSRKVGDLQVASRSLLVLGHARVDMGELECGVALLQEALQIVWEQRNLIVVAMCFSSLAKASGAKGDIRRAALLWGAAERIDTDLGTTQWRSGKAQYEAELPPAVLAAEEGIAAGKALTTAEAVELALSMK